MSSNSDKKPDEELKRFFEIQPVFVQDDSPEGEYQATRLSEAKTSLYLDLPFFGWILGHLEVFPTRDPLIETYAADTRRIYFNPSFLEDKTKERLKGMLMHTVIHLVMKHADRRSTADGNLWGISSDVITNILVDETHAKIFDDHTRFQPRYEKTSNWEIDNIDKIPDHLRKRSVEENYKILKDYAESLKGIEDSNEPVTKDGKYKEYYSPEVYEEVRDYSGIESPCGFTRAMDRLGEAIGEDLEGMESDRLTGIIRSGMSQSRDFGKLPAALREMISELLHPKVPWYVMLEQYIQKSIISDWRWNPPNRRLVGHNVHLPSTTKEYLNVVVALDTSGSISRSELTNFASESHAIISSFSTVRMILIDCDAKVQHVSYIEAGQSIDGTVLPWEGRAFQGRGGTSFVPVFEWVEANNEDPDLLIYFTDGYGSYPAHEPGYPVIWVMTTEYDTPFGHIIRYESFEDKPA